METLPEPAGRIRANYLSLIEAWPLENSVPLRGAAAFRWWLPLGSAWSCGCSQVWHCALR